MEISQQNFSKFGKNMLTISKVGYNMYLKFPSLDITERRPGDVQ
nr:MAG TPA: hypothetical protein [Caudoviricetes sp.]